MTGLYLPGAKWCPVPYRAEAGPFTTPPLGYIPHVQVGAGSLFGYFSRLRSPARKFSTAWIAKDGHCEQYTELSMKPWAQGSGNGQYHAFETEGTPGEPLTPAQINTLAIWHNFLGTPDVLANAPGQRGIGTHVMGGAAWGNHSCPGPLRAAQRAQIIARARLLRGNTPTPPRPAQEEDAMYLIQGPTPAPAVYKTDGFRKTHIGPSELADWTKVLGHGAEKVSQGTIDALTEVAK